MLGFAGALPNLRLLEEIGNTDTILSLQAGSERESDLVVQTRIERAISAIGRLGRGAET